MHMWLSAAPKPCGMRRYRASCSGSATAGQLTDRACATQVFGNLFGVLATIFSVAAFRNPVSLAGMGGYGLTILGVLLFMREKHGKGAAAPPQPKLLLEGGANAA